MVLTLSLDKISNKKQVFDDIKSKIAFVKETLEGWQRSWLMVFDNYDQPSAFKDIPTYFPQGESGTILFTSRQANSECLRDTIGITQMTEDESLELLVHQSKHERNSNNIVEGRKIVKKLGIYPLSWIKQGHILTHETFLSNFLQGIMMNKEKLC